MNGHNGTLTTHTQPMFPFRSTWWSRDEPDDFDANLMDGREAKPR